MDISDNNALDPKQMGRIEAVHRGFLYQHLYTVGCLLTALEKGFTSVSVEKDEDIEIECDVFSHYVQVKTRSRAIQPSDLTDVFLRFDELRNEHAEGRRSKVAKFTIITDQLPSQKLLKQIDEGQFPPDTAIEWPSGKTRIKASKHPAAWISVEDGIQWCIEKAESLPFKLISAESLVWKLAGIVQLAATGQRKDGGHTFKVDKLASLFEQIIFNLQEFPSPPILYRVQESEPPLLSCSHVRIISGFSGAGKTAWISQAVLHAGNLNIYFDVGDYRGAAIASKLVQEIVPRALSGEDILVSRILQPGANGIEGLRLLNIRLDELAIEVAVVIDNFHQVPFDSLAAIIKVGSNLRFILLGQPSSTVEELEAAFLIQAETLGGWGVDTLALEVRELGGRATPGGLMRLRRLTGGMPLYVKGAIQVAVNEYSSDVDLLCESLIQQKHTKNTAQETILKKMITDLSDEYQDATAILGLSDIWLSLEEIEILLKNGLQFSEAATGRFVREIRKLGIASILGPDRIKIHDSIRILAASRFTLFEDGKSVCALQTLSELLKKSLLEERDISRFSLFVSTLVRLGDIETLLDLAGDELFHEMGLTGEIYKYLESVANNDKFPDKNRFAALNSLVLHEMKLGDGKERIGAWIDEMETLLENPSLDFSDRMDFMMKRMLHHASEGEAESVLVAVCEVERHMLGTSDPRRNQVYYHNCAHALMQVRRYIEAENLIDKSIECCYEVLNVRAEQICFKNISDIRSELDATRVDSVDLKHIADSFEVKAVIKNQRGYDSGLFRIQSFKFFLMAGAYDSAVRIGENVVEEFLDRKDFEGARQFCENFVLPTLSETQLVERFISVRGLYAVVLAYCGKGESARHEIEQILPYCVGLEPAEASTVIRQRDLIEEIISKFKSNSLPATSQKIGRNEACPCGSGKKYKKCHGGVN